MNPYSSIGGRLRKADMLTVTPHVAPKKVGYQSVKGSLAEHVDEMVCLILIVKSSNTPNPGLIEHK